MKTVEKIILFAAIASASCGMTLAQQNRKAIIQQEKSIVIQKGEDGDEPPPVMIQRERRKMKLDGLTPEQTKQMKEIRMKAALDIKPMKNLANEKKAHLKTLSESDSPKQEEINKTIEEMGALHINIKKRQELAKQDIRKLLTPEQRMQFDRRSKEKKRAGHPKMQMLKIER